MLRANNPTIRISFLICANFSVVAMSISKRFGRGLSSTISHYSINLNGNLGFNVVNAGSFLFKCKSISKELFILSFRQADQVQNSKRPHYSFSIVKIEQALDNSKFANT